MKAVLLLVVFVVAAQAARQICLSDTFTTKQVTFLPSEQDVLGSQTWYSWDLQKTRTDYDVIVIDDKFTHYRVSYIFDVPQKTFFKIDYFNNTAKCEVHPLNGKLPEICLARNAEKRGDYTLGGSLEVENWIETFSTRNGTAIHVDLGLAKNVNVPVRVVTRDLDLGIRIEEFWDWKDSVHHDAFIVPSVCKNNLATLGKQARSISEVLTSAHPIAKASLFFSKF